MKNIYKIFIYNIYEIFNILYKWNNCILKNNKCNNLNVYLFLNFCGLLYFFSDICL